MLEVPPVTHHDADGLAAMAKKVLNGAGVKDSHLEGIGWDGQYVHLGVMEKLRAVRHTRYGHSGCGSPRCGNQPTILN